MKFLATSVAIATLVTLSVESRADDKLESAVKADYDAHLDALFKHFHANPELSFVEVKTAARLAKEFRDAGFEVTEGVGRLSITPASHGPVPAAGIRQPAPGSATSGGSYPRSPTPTSS